MRENFYKTRNYDDHTTFGGLIHNSDFDTYHSMSDIVSRIIYDQKFDKMCKSLSESRKRKIKENN